MRKISRFPETKGFVVIEPSGTTKGSINTTRSWPQKFDVSQHIVVVKPELLVVVMKKLGK